LTGKLSRRYIKDAKDLKIRISEMDNQPDSDGYYRINDFFCFDNTWKAVLLSLVHRNQVVLMDVRTFTPSNKDCAYEITELLNIIPFKKIVFVIDTTTNLTFLNETFQNTLRDIKETSPNKYHDISEISLFKFIDLGDKEVRKLLYTLCIAAA
jgi:hypothetical protein